MLDFEIKDNLIFVNNSVVALFEIDPIDIFLLSEEDRYAFFSKMYSLFNLLKDEIQFNVVIRQSLIKDFENHFLSMMRSSEGYEKREDYVQSNINDLKTLIEDRNNKILTKSFYFEIKEKCDTNQDRSVILAINKLNHKFQRIYTSMSDARLKATQIVEPLLSKLLKQYY